MEGGSRHLQLCFDCSNYALANGFSFRGLGGAELGRLVSGVELTLLEPIVENIVAKIIIIIKCLKM